MTHTHIHTHTHHSTDPFSAAFFAMAEARRSQQTALLDEEQLEPWALFARKASWGEVQNRGT